MRVRPSDGGLAVQAIVGSNTVLLGIDIDESRRPGLLGFGLHRTDHTECEAYWLRGMKTFAGTRPAPAPGQTYLMRDHPLQGFQWGDYSAKPDHDYTY